MKARRPDVDSFKKIDGELLKAIVDNPYECPIIIDVKGNIRFICSHYKELVGIDPDWAIGKPVKEVIPETNLDEVVITGRARIGETLYIAGKQQIISRIPLRNRDGRIIGALGKGMFHQVSKILDVHKRLELLDGQLSHFKKEANVLRKSKAFIGQSPLILEAKRLALEVSDSNLSIHLTGESGTGKEAIAYYIHEKSPRAKGPFIRVNCAAIPHELFESELFGYEKGAFTGARSKGKPGKFELADGGTILLDEIGEMPLNMQSKLLRVLQEHEVERLGSDRTIPLNYRLITSTNRNLQDMVNRNLFRTDLFFRINAFHIHLPSLREMPEDVPVITHHLLSLLKEDIGPKALSISRQSMELLRRYDWPGNVRELRNVLERALIMARGGGVIGPEHLPERIVNFGKEAKIDIRPERGLKRALEETESRLIEEALRSVEGNKVKAARILGIPRSSLYEKIKHHGIR